MFQIQLLLQINGNCDVTVCMRQNDTLEYKVKCCQLTVDFFAIGKQIVLTLSYLIYLTTIAL